MSVDTPSILCVFLQSCIGCSPTVIDKYKECNGLKLFGRRQRRREQQDYSNIGSDDDTSSYKDWFWIILCNFILPYINLLDAIFHILLSIQTITYSTSTSSSSTDQKEYTLCILLIGMTIFCRFITGLYGIASWLRLKNIHVDEDDTITEQGYLIMELTIFLLEDGCAILLFLNMDNLIYSFDSYYNGIQSFSLLLTTIGSLLLSIFVMMIVGSFLFTFIDNVFCKKRAECIWNEFCMFILLLVILSGIPLLMNIIFFKNIVWRMLQVMTRQQQEYEFVPLSEGMETVLYINYGVMALFFGFLSTILFWSDARHFHELQ